jgi:ABC-2 type transport system permease protein
MSATSTAGPRLAPSSGARQRAEVARTFFSILGRDLFVTGRELPTFLAQVILQPLFMVFVFGTQLTDVAIGSPSLEDVFIALTGRALR